MEPMSFRWVGLRSHQVSFEQGVTPSCKSCPQPCLCEVINIWTLKTSWRNRWSCGLSSSRTRVPTLSLLTSSSLLRFWRSNSRCSSMLKDSRFSSRSLLLILFNPFDVAVEHQIKLAGTMVWDYEKNLSLAWSMTLWFASLCMFL